MKQLVHSADRIALIGVPSSAGARQVGQELAPRCLRRSGLVERLRSIGYDVLDLGDVDGVSYSPDAENPKQQNLRSVLSVLTEVTSAVDQAVWNQARPVVLGGDCTVTLGVLASLAKHCSNLGMIYFDGDVDLNTPTTTTSGIFDGMVLAHAIGLGAEQLSHFGPRVPLMDQSKITLFGYSVQAGGIDPIEISLLQEVRMAKYPLERIQDNVQAFAAQALAELEEQADNILVHFDVDVVDFKDFAAADVPHHPGISLAQAQEALSVFLASSNVAGLALTEFNGRRDSDMTLAKRLVDTLVGALTCAQSCR